MARSALRDPPENSGLARYLAALDRILGPEPYDDWYTASDHVKRVLGQEAATRGRAAWAWPSPIYADLVLVPDLARIAGSDRATKMARDFPEVLQHFAALEQAQARRDAPTHERTREGERAKEVPFGNAELVVAAAFVSEKVKGGPSLNALYERTAKRLGIDRGVVRRVIERLARYAEPFGERWRLLLDRALLAVASILAELDARAAPATAVVRIAR